MTIQELRVGNWIRFGVINDVRVKAINPKTLICKASESRSGKDEICDMIQFEGDTAIGNDEIDCFSEIPLSEKILLRCGFKRLDEFEETCVSKKEFTEILFTLISEVYVGKSEKTGMYHFLSVDTCQGYYFFKSISAPMKYVHTLQNYFFTFKGEELKINL